VNTPLDVEGNDEHAPYFFFSTISPPFSVSMRLDFQCTAHALFPKRLSNIAKVSVTLFPRFVHNLMLCFGRIHREIARGQIHDSK
jgi:hypothetical protein